MNVTLTEAEAAVVHKALAYAIHYYGPFNADPKGARATAERLLPMFEVVDEPADRREPRAAATVEAARLPAVEQDSRPNEQDSREFCPACRLPPHTCKTHNDVHVHAHQNCGLPLDRRRSYDACACRDTKQPVCIAGQRHDPTAPPFKHLKKGDRVRDVHNNDTGTVVFNVNNPEDAYYAPNTGATLFVNWDDDTSGTCPPGAVQLIAPAALAEPADRREPRAAATVEAARLPAVERIQCPDPVCCPPAPPAAPDQPAARTTFSDALNRIDDLLTSNNDYLQKYRDEKARADSLSNAFLFLGRSFMGGFYAHKEKGGEYIAARCRLKSVKMDTWLDAVVYVSTHSGELFVRDRENFDVKMTKKG